MKKTLLAIALASSLTSVGALAADKAPEPDFSITGNFGLFSDYRFRGMSQTDKAPAAQGGFDLGHKSGFYIGTWTSNVADWANASGNGQELDIYAGVKKELGPIALDVGYLAYIYPSNSTAVAQGTREWYLGASYGPVTYKVSRTTGNWFGIANSSGSIYHDLSVSHSINDSITISAHAGKQDVKATGSDDRDFNDYKLQLTYALKDNYAVGLAYISTSGLSSNAKSGFTSNGKKLYGSGAVLSLTKTF